MLLVTFVLPRDGATRLGLLEPRDRILDLAELGRRAGSSLPLTDLKLLAAGGVAAQKALHDLLEASSAEDSPRFGLNQVRLLAPIPRPGKMLCAGVNYRDHVLEIQGHSLPDEPFFFAKLPSVVIGPFDDIIHPGAPHTVDYEVELACVIGTGGHHIPAGRALEHVFGYTILNDVSARDVQFKNNQLTLGKNFETFAPMGPCVATPEELVDPRDVEARTFANGELRQCARTSTMLFDVPTLIAWVSDVCRLEPGDVISTGTPAGVGAFRSPPSFLEPGDMVRMEIDGIRTIENRVR